MTGSTGLIGSAVRRELAQMGHEILAAGRSHGHTAPSLVMDYATPPSREWWGARLTGVDVVINAAGIFKEKQPGDFENIHSRGPIELFEGAALAGVRLVVQISALGADDSSTTAFQRSKRQADKALADMAIPSVTVLPSLVFSHEGKSSKFFLLLAWSRVLVLPRSNARIQPVHLSDLVESITRLATQPSADKRIVYGVGPRPMTLQGYLQTLRTSLQLRRRPWVIGLPARRVRAVAVLAGTAGVGFVSEDALAMLLRGNTAPVEPLAKTLGRLPKDPSEFISEASAVTWLNDLRLSMAYCMMRAAFAAVWLWTALVSFGLYPVNDSLLLLREFGLQGSAAWIALYAGAAVDLAIGIGLVTVPKTYMQRLWALQFLVIAVYTVMISVTMPHWWLHPFGPLTKNLPMLAGIVLMMRMQPRS